MTTVTPLSLPRAPGLRIEGSVNPAVALGLAVCHLMTKPAFAGLPFGAWSRVLVGQINRGHYRLILDDEGQVRGFVGWALCTEAAGDAWLLGRDFAGGQADQGDCILFNAWSADTPPANRLALAAAREAMLGRRLAYFRRVYPDGTSRPMRMPVNAFVGHKLSGHGRSGAPGDRARNGGPAAVRRDDVN